MAAFPDTFVAVASFAERASSAAAPLFYKEWSNDRRICKISLPWAAVCGLGALELSSLQQLPVQDVIAPPTVKPSFYKLVPRTVPPKCSRYRRRVGVGGAGGGGGGGAVDVSFSGDGGSIYGGDGFSGGFGGGGSGDGGGNGWERWGDDWNDEWRQFQRNGEALVFLYQAVCWASLSRCVHYALSTTLQLPVGTASSQSDKGELHGAFGLCTSAFGLRPRMLQGRVPPS